MKIRRQGLAAHWSTDSSQIVKEGSSGAGKLNTVPATAVDALINAS